MRQATVLKNPNFLLFFGGQLVSRLGDGIYSLALVWMVHVLTNSTLLMSFTLAAGFIPRIVLGPVVGVFVDRWHKRRTLLITDLLRLIVVSLLAALTFAHLASPWLLIVFSFILASVSVFFSPAYYVLQKHIVSDDQLTKAYSWQQVSTNISQIAGPALAGIIIGTLGVGLAFTVDAATFLVSLAGFLLVRVEEPPQITTKLSVASVVSDMKDGMAALRKVDQVRALTPFMLVYNFVLAAFENLLIVQFITNVLHHGASAVGLVTTCAAVGELVSGTVLAFIKTNWTTARGMIISMVIGAITVAFMGVSQSIWVVGGLMFINGFFLSIVNVSFFAGIQQSIPTEALGRVWAILGALFDGATPLSQIAFGALAGLISVGWVISFGGIAATVTGVTALFHPAIKGTAQDGVPDMNSSAISNDEALDS